MKAAILIAYGDVDRLEISEEPEPPVGPNDVKVKMAGASINPVDWKLRSGALEALMPLTFPAVLGRDASGEVVELGSAVARFRLGDRVMGLVEGAYAETVVAPASAWVEVPPTMDLADAGALPLVLLTGAQLIEDAILLRKGNVVLITGAVGSVGRVAVFVAKSIGAQVYAGVRDEQRALAEELGADFVVALDRDDEIATLPPLDAIADTIGGPTLAKLFGKVKPGGTIGTVLGDPEGAREQCLTVRALTTRPDPARLGALAQAVLDGRLTVPIVKRLPLAEVRAAQSFAQHHARGKVLLTGDVHRQPIAPLARELGHLGYPDPETTETGRDASSRRLPLTWFV